jgi:hypothetical protein
MSRQPIKKVERPSQDAEGAATGSMHSATFSTRRKPLRQRHLPDAAGMKAEGMGASEIAKALKIGRASVYRALEEGA